MKLYGKPFEKDEYLSFANDIWNFQQWYKGACSHRAKGSMVHCNILAVNWEPIDFEYRVTMRACAMVVPTTQANDARFWRYFAVHKLRHLGLLRDEINCLNHRTILPQSNHYFLIFYHTIQCLQSVNTFNEAF